MRRANRVAKGKTKQKKKQKQKRKKIGDKVWVSLTGGATAVALALIGLAATEIENTAEQYNFTDTHCSVVREEAATQQDLMQERIRYYDSDISDNVADICNVNEYLAKREALIQQKPPAS